MRKNTFLLNFWNVKVTFESLLNCFKSTSIEFMHPISQEVDILS